MKENTKKKYFYLITIIMITIINNNNNFKVVRLFDRQKDQLNHLSGCAQFCYNHMSK